MEINKTLMYYANNVYACNITNPAKSIQPLSFRGNADLFITENTQSALVIAKELLNLPHKSFNVKKISEILNVNSPIPLNVSEMSVARIEYPFIPQNSVAHMLPMYNSDMQLATAMLAINTGNTNSKERIANIADISHEYTHVLQRNKDKTYYGLSKIQDANKIRSIARAAQTIISTVTSEMAQKTFKNKNVNTVLHDRAHERFNLAEVIGGKTNLCAYIDLMSQRLSDSINMDKEEIKNYLKNWIKQEAGNEIEAYQTTVEVLKNNDGSLSVLGNRLLTQDFYKIIKTECENI